MSTRQSYLYPQSLQSEPFINQPVAIVVLIHQNARSPADIHLFFYHCNHLLKVFTHQHQYLLPNVPLSEEVLVQKCAPLYLNMDNMQKSKHKTIQLSCEPILRLNTFRLCTQINRYKNKYN